MPVMVRMLATLTWTFAIIVPVATFGENGVVLPHDPYVYIGNNLTLNCNLTRFDTPYDSQNLVFTRHSDERVPSKYVSITSTRSIVLRYPITSAEDAGNYMCKIVQPNARPIIIGFQAVTVEYEPRPVTDIACRVFNWENMTCTWDLGVTFLHPNTIEIQLVWAVSNQNNCPHQTRTSCTWLGVDGDNTFISDATYFMGVTIINTMTKPDPTYYPKKAVVKRINTSELVEPAPVTNLTVVTNSTCVILSWTHAHVQRDKVYKVDFSRTDIPGWQTKHVDDDETLTLCGLHPYTSYIFNVSCKPRLFNRDVKGFWSKPASVQVLTDEDVPTKPPVLGTGSYMEVPCQRLCKHLHLYWQPVSKENRNGEITYYKIDYQNLDSGEDSWNSLSAFVTQNVLMLVATDTYKIQMRAATSKGVSSVFSEIIVPAKSRKPQVPEHIVEAENATEDSRVTISWTPPRVVHSSHWHNLTSYTVYWCRGYKVGWTCQEPVQMLEVAVDQRQVSMDISQVERYMFGVAVNALLPSGQFISSGFKWNTCNFIQSARPEVAVKNVRLASYQPNSGLEILWDQLTCKETHAYIHSYLVNICSSSSADNCTDGVQVYEVPSSQSQYLVEGLNAGMQYKVWLIAAAHGGLGPHSDYLYHTVINRRLKTGEVAGIVIGALFIFIIALLGILLFCRHVFMTVKRKYFMPVPIEIPHTLPPLPPIPMPRAQISPDSDTSEGIYEKIDGPPSPSSSTESTTGVEAPLIHQNWKVSTFKSQLYGKMSDDRSGNDSGRGSLSHSADTLWMRLHPSHLKKHKKYGKKSQKSESDSGIIVDGRGQVCTYSRGQSDRFAIQGLPGARKDNQNVDGFTDHGCEEQGCVVNVKASASPYSCVDIIDKIECNSERLMRKCSETHLYNACDCQDTYKGSTVSLPPGLGKLVSCMSPLIDNKARSTGNQLDIEERRLSSMKETRECESSDVYSEGSTLDSVGDGEHETSESGGSQESKLPPVDLFQTSGSCGHSWVNSDCEASSGIHSGTSNPTTIDSYIQVANSSSTTPSLHNGYMDDNSDFVTSLCNCSCHSNKKPVANPIVNGYVTEAVMNQHTEEHCQCHVGQQTMDMKSASKPDLHYGLGKHGLHTDSQVFNLPPHFFGSMSSVPMDPSRTTEL